MLKNKAQTYDKDGELDGKYLEITGQFCLSLMNHETH